MNRGEFTLPEEMSVKDKIDCRRQAIKDGGFYGKSNVWNSIVTIPGDPNLYRKRVETLIIKNNKEVFLKKKPNGEYLLPGGSTEKDIPDDTQAVNECREEARVKVENIAYTGITYKTVYSKSTISSWILDEVPNKYLVWYGTITDVYVGTYGGMDHEKVDDADRDRFIESGRFYPIKDFFKIATKEHREAMMWYLRFYSKKDSVTTDDNEEFTESYINNYFKNKKFIKSFINDNDIKAAEVDKMLSIIDKTYDQLSVKSKYKRELKTNTDDHFVFHPVLTFDFKDGTTFTVCLIFMDKFATGETFKSEEYGDLILLYPDYFKQSIDGKRLTLLHEIGHIRLGHIDASNMHKTAFGLGKADTNEHRSKLVDKGKTPYVEWMADLYAVLNGAKMYAITDTLPNKDSDGRYDYFITRAELARRYSKVYDWMRKHNAFGSVIESTSVLEKKLDKPEECPNCKSKNIGVYLHGEPIFKCKDCGKVLGVVPFPESTSIDDIKKGLYLLESARKRSNLPDSAFGTNDRRYPLDTKKHVLSAIRLFGHCDEKSRPLLAKRILAAMKKYNISRDVIGPKNSINNYI